MNRSLTEILAGFRFIWSEKVVAQRAVSLDLFCRAARQCGGADAGLRA